MGEHRKPGAKMPGLVGCGLGLLLALAGCTAGEPWHAGREAVWPEQAVLAEAAPADVPSGQQGETVTAALQPEMPAASADASATEPAAEAEVAPADPEADERKLIALTFDDGPDGRYTPKVLEILKAQEVRATFFLVGTQVEKYPDTARQIAEEGHEIGNHSWSHRDLSKLTAKELDGQVLRTQQAIEEAAGVTPQLVRAPYGALSDTLLDYVFAAQLKHVYWTIDPRDWAGTPTDEMRKNIREHARTGSVILLHSFGGRKHALDHTLALLPLIIEDLRGEGFEFATVSELAEAGQAGRTVVRTAP